MKITTAIISLLTCLVAAAPSESVRVLTKRQVTLPNPPPAAASAVFSTPVYSGSGCPQGSAPNFPDLIASSGPGVSPTSARKNCQITFSVSVAPGYKYRPVVQNLPNAISVSLQSGVTGQYIVLYHHGGQTNQFTYNLSFTGPSITSTTASIGNSQFTPPLWSACGTGSTFVINHSVNVAGSGSGVSSITFPGADVAATFDNAKYWFEFATC